MELRSDQGMGTASGSKIKLGHYPPLGTVQFEFTRPLSEATGARKSRMGFAV